MKAVFCVFGAFLDRVGGGVGSHRFLCPLHTLCFGEHNSYRTSVQRYPGSFYALPPSLHLQQVYLAEQSELQVPRSHERRQRQQLIFRPTSLPDTLWALQDNEWDVVRSSFPLGQRSVCNPFVSFPLKANNGYTLFKKKPQPSKTHITCNLIVDSYSIYFSLPIYNPLNHWPEITAFPQARRSCKFLTFNTTWFQDWQTASLVREGN